jgi:hypothetical protein
MHGEKVHNRSKRFLLIVCACLYFKLSVAQIDSSDYKDHSLYLYKTEDDFFNKKKIYRGQYIPSDDKKVIRYTANSRRRTLDLGDSCSYYFGYEVGGEIQIRPDKDPGNFSYYAFGGGTRDCYFVVYGYLPNYDRQGYLLGLTSPGGMMFMYFVDHQRKLNMVQLPELLKSKPVLLEQYKAEKLRADKLAWDRSRLATGVKYLKLFIAAKHS